MATDPERVKTLFLAAIERDDPANRLAFLDGAVGGDAELRDRLDALLAAYDQPPGALDRPLGADPEATRRCGRDEGRTGGVESRADEARHRGIEAVTGPGGAVPPAPTDGFFPAVYDELKRLAAARLAGEGAGIRSMPRRWSTRRTSAWAPRRSPIAAASSARRGGGHAADPGRPRPPPQGRSPRRRGRTIALDGDAPAFGIDPDLVLDVDAALERLAREAPSSPKVARHRLFAGLSIEETALALGLSARHRVPRVGLRPLLAGHRARCGPMTGATGARNRRR